MPFIKMYKYIPMVIALLLSVSFHLSTNSIKTMMDTSDEMIEKRNDVVVISPNQDQILSKTTIANYKYRDGGPSNVSMRDHPHAGARDANGDWNYVPDVTLVRRIVLEQLVDDSIDTYHYFPLEPELLELVCQIAPGAGEEGFGGYELLRYVHLNGTDPIPDSFFMNETNSTIHVVNDIRNLSSLPRILCSIYTYELRHHQIQAIGETWGWRCDGFFAASTKTNTTIGAIDLPHHGEENYNNMWQKTRSILAFMFDNYMDEYDYFYLAGDDTYVIVENLQNYLHLLESFEGGRDTRPLYIGNQIPWTDMIFNGGGSGYIVNRVALQRFVMEALPNCFVDDETSMEDVYFAKCMLQIGILPIDTADIAHRQRFHGVNPNTIADWNPPTDGYYLERYNHWAKDHGWRYGMNLSSTQSVAFHHFSTPASMKRYHAIIYNSCPVGTVLRDAIDQ
jgi:glycoprotein-N-acetylgalactosamine 3-beta-galactosyltransferase